MLPGSILWRNSLPIEGTSGRLLADFLVHYLNLPGAAIVLTLMVAVSLYLATTFTFNTAREWATIRFGFVQRLWNWWVQRRNRRAGAEAVLEGGTYGSKREQADAKARRARELAEEAERRRLEPENATLLSGLFGWLSRKKRVDPIAVAPEEVAVAGQPASMWQGMPRTLVDAPPVTAYGTAAAAVAPFADVLAKAAAPVHALDDHSNFSDRGFRFDAEELLPVKAPAPAKAAKKVVEEPRASFPAAPSTLPDGITRSAGARMQTSKPVTIVPKSVRGYKLPSSSLLYRNEEHTIVREEALREEARVLVQKSAEFGVDGQVTQINPGPVVTTFEFKPEAGVKVARITGLADDLCLAMAAESILIERMPGKSTVGIQVPNHERETIWLRDVVECESFAQSKSKLAIALGKDINGRIVTADLASMPHVLIAGSTGSGKSVAINAMIMSVLFKSTPEQVRMILVDPKRVELGMYEGIPHLFTSIILEAKLAANALRNAVREMERRLKLLAANHVRNIDQFNKLFEHGSEYLFEDGEPGTAAPTSSSSSTSSPT